MVAVLAAPAGGATLPATSSDDHVWFVTGTARPDAPLELRHHAREMEGPYFSRDVTLPEVPEAMAAWGDRLWLVFGPSQAGGQRQAFTRRIQRNPALGGWYPQPHDRLRAVAGLTGAGRLADLAGTAAGPVALLLPAGSDPDAPPELLRLRADGWDPLELPPEFDAGPDARCFLGAAGDRGERLVLVRAGDPAGVWWRSPDGAWSRQAAPPALPHLRRVTRIGRYPVTVEVAAAPALAYLRPGLTLPLSQPDAPAGHWAAVGLRDGVRLIAEAGDGALTLRRVDPLDGEVSDPKTMSSQPLMRARVVYRPLLFAVLITAFMLLLLFRPDPKAVALPAHVRVLRAAPRLVALGIDLLVGAFVAVLVLDCPVRDLIWWPLWTPDLAATAPAALMLAVAVAHSTVSELLWRRSAGKALLGARVAALDGSRPSVPAVALRNLVKALVLLVPVLAVFALLNPQLQGLGDMVSRTVVVRDLPAGGESGSEGR